MIRLCTCVQILLLAIVLSQISGGSELSQAFSVGNIENQQSLANNGNCRPETTFVDCSGRGVCVDGNCECEIRPQASEVISGKYCECDNYSCDRQNALLCSGHGTCTCGVCLCHSGWSGEACNFQDHRKYATDDNRNCRPENSFLLCSGRGVCIEGNCECDKRFRASEVISGKYCECDNFSCDRHNAILCSGHGICSCGVCQCHSGWRGDACDIHV